MMTTISKWYDNWRHAVAWIYIFLVFLDYAVRPTLNYINRKENDPVEILLKLKGYDPSIQLSAVQVVSKNNGMEPILNEFVHVAFGAILTGASITRGMEKTATARRYVNNIADSNDFDQNNNLNNNRNVNRPAEVTRPSLNLDDPRAGTIVEQ